MFSFKTKMLQKKNCGVKPQTDKWWEVSRHLSSGLPVSMTSAMTELMNLQIREQLVQIRDEEASLCFSSLMCVVYVWAGGQSQMKNYVAGNQSGECTHTFSHKATSYLLCSHIQFHVTDNRDAYISTLLLRTMKTYVLVYWQHAPVSLHPNHPC